MIPADSPLVLSLSSPERVTASNVTYAFTAAGVTVDTTETNGSTSQSLAWSGTQKDFVRDTFTYISTLIDLTFEEVASTNVAIIDYTQVAVLGDNTTGYSTPSVAGQSEIVVPTFYIGLEDVTLIHETGHSLALSHPFDGPANLPGVTKDSDLGTFNLNTELATRMSYNPGAALEQPGLDIKGEESTFGAIDIAALQLVFGANTKTGLGNTVYGDDTSRVSTIWDNGGIDTINYSSATNNAVIDLRAASLKVEEGGAGYFSFIGRENGKVALGGYTIAFGVTVENGVGGSGRDKITGNDVANVLTGGAGNDTLSGRGGNDFLVGGATTDASGTTGGQVYRLYEATLARAPDTAGFAGWVDQLDSGARSIQQITTGFVASKEFQKVYGTLTDRDFVTLLYKNVLDRAPDAAGLNGWLEKLSSGVARENVVLGFSESKEFKASTNVEASAYAGALAGRVQSGFTDDVFRLYEATLNRAPDAVGLEHWSEKLAEGQSYVSIASGFTNSTEFRNTYGSLDNAGFVNQLYRNVLDREGDAAGRASFLNKLENGTTREEIVREFAESKEFINDTQAAFKTYITRKGGDVLEGGAGKDTLASGSSADTFVFNAAEDGRDTVLQFDAWGKLQFVGFGYDDATDATAKMSASGADILFADQGVSIVFAGADLATLQAADYLFAA